MRIIAGIDTTTTTRTLAPAGLRYEVKAEYPYSTHLCDTLEEVNALVAFERNVHNVSCRIRLVSNYVAPNKLNLLPSRRNQSASTGLHAQLERYIEARGLVFSSDRLSGRKVAEEALEFALEVAAGNLEAARLELGDVGLAAARQADLLNTTVEECIELKIAADTGRGA